MNKEILKKAWFLALLLLVITIALGLFLAFVSRILGMDDYALIGIASMAGVILIGQIYVANFKEVMPNNLRWKVIVFYILPQIVVGALYPLVAETFSYGIFMIILIAASILYSLLIYHSLGYVGKMYLKMLQKRGTMD